MARQLDGIALGAVAAGGLFAYAGIKGYSVPLALQNLVTGKHPNTGQNAAALTSPGGGSGAGNFRALPSQSQTGSGGSHAANQALGRLLAASYGWGTGENWKALNYGWGTLESGWDSHIKNSSSGAYGIAQALGHGSAADAGSESDAYGGWGLTHSEAKSANSGSAYWQIVWGLRYIKISYGSPSQVPGWLGQGGYVGY